MKGDPRSEREKMLAEELYLAADPELLAGRARAEQLTRRYNSSDLSWPQRAELIYELFDHVGNNVQITPHFIATTAATFASATIST